ncbi:molybdopterin-dependent oxidoreductase [Geoglobus ahangari]
MLPPGQKEIPDLPVLNVSGIPDVDISSYSLKVTGRVENSLTLTYDSLMEMERVEVEVPAHCVEGWSVLGIRWEGVPARTVMEMAKPTNASYVLVRSLDDYTTVIPVEYFERSLLALKMNGDVLPAEHGFPVRLVVPDLYFWKSAKWVCELVFTDSPEGGYWEERGYHIVGNVWEGQRRDG